MSEKIITFSIAAYNIEKYIDECVGSLLNIGKNDEIELLIINDGSSDDTAVIAREYERKYPGTVRLINKENGGHGSTINKGIEEARGKYFRALDGDDWVNSSETSKLIERLKETEADAVICNYTDCYSEEKVPSVLFSSLENNRVYSLSEIDRLSGWIRYHAVIFKTDILQDNKILLDEHCFYVDTEYLVYSMAHVNNIIYFDFNIYCYRRDNEAQSINQQSRMRNILHSKKVAISLLRYFVRNKMKYDRGRREYIMSGIAMHCIWHFRGLTFFAPDNKKKLELIKFERYIKRMSPEVFRMMTTTASNRDKGDVKIVRALRLTDYHIFNAYGIYRKAKPMLIAKARTLLKRG